MTDASALDGPRLLPDGGERPDRLVVLLHGIGADGNDLIGLAPLLPSVLPRARVVSPNAPFPFDMAPFGYMWFSIGNLTSDHADRTACAPRRRC